MIKKKLRACMSMMRSSRVIWSIMDIVYKLDIQHTISKETI